MRGPLGRLPHERLASDTEGLGECDDCLPGRLTPPLFQLSNAVAVHPRPLGECRLQTLALGGRQQGRVVVDASGGSGGQDEGEGEGRGEQQAYNFTFGGVAASGAASKKAFG